MEKIELKRCPFCGGKAVEIEPKLKDGGTFWKIRCTNCYATIKGSHRRMNREAWNRRTKDETQD